VLTLHIFKNIKIRKEMFIQFSEKVITANIEIRIINPENNVWTRIKRT
jgi:hypothetical protein